jgi:competence ComEA-like helix-hairpin-helix protein
MKLTSDEHRALAFIAGLLFLSAAVRLASLPEAVAVPGEALDLDAHIAATERLVAEAERMRTPLAPGERIDPNTAPVVELARLPRVGPAVAERIVQDRERHGPFHSAADLARVPGIGPQTVASLTPHLSLDHGAPPVAGRPIAQSPSRPVPRSGWSGPGADVVDLNLASAAELESLPGIGPSLAGRIVAYRDSVGRLESVDDLMAVRGIGEATLARIRDRVRVGW